MGLLRIAAAGAIGYFAYQAWQRRQSAASAIDTDASDDTVDHPLTDDVPDDASNAYDDVTSNPGASAH